jgi:integrase
MGKSYSSVSGWRVCPDSGRFTSFIYYDSKLKKNLRVTENIPENLFDLKKANEFKEKYLRSVKASVYKAKKNLEFIERFKKYKEVHEEYLRWAKKQAPGAWRNYDAYLRNHVYRYFLEENNYTNPETWKHHYFEFKEWLETAKSIRGNTKSGDGTLTINTRNHVIESLNSFLSFLEDVKIEGPFVRCSKFDRPKPKGLEYVYREEELTQLFEFAEKHHSKKMSVLFKTLYQEFLRLNEGLGLHLDSVIMGEVPGPQLKRLCRELRDHNVEVYGFILLKDQPTLESMRDEKGRVLRRPLKHRKHISLKDGRYIPITDQTLAEELDELIHEQTNNYRKKRFGPNREDYLLFDIKYSEPYDVLVAAKKVILTLGDKTTHDLRHTGATHLARKLSGDKALIKQMLGHKRDEETEHYVHLAEELEVMHSQLAKSRKTRKPIKAISID